MEYIVPVNLNTSHFHNFRWLLLLPFCTPQSYSMVDVYISIVSVVFVIQVILGNSYQIGIQYLYVDVLWIEFLWHVMTYVVKR